MNELELRLAILQLAICFCFDEGDDYLSVHQIIERKLTPIEAYTRICIYELVNNGAVECVNCSTPDCAVMDTIFIKRLANYGKEMEEFVYSVSENLIDLIMASPEYEKFLRSFLDDIKACECIEYSFFYGEKSEINIIDASIHDVKLRLLFLKCSQNKIQMLLWRAIKEISKKCLANRDVPFSKVTNAAFDYYVSYSKEDIEIDSYQRPRALKPSILSGMLEIFCSKNPNL